MGVRTIKKYMDKDKKILEIIKLDSEIMDCFKSDEELIVISGGKGLIDIIKGLIPDINLGNCAENCHCNERC